MMEECRYCGSGRTVPVLDVRMRGQPHGGNPFRSRCLECARWLPMASKNDWKDHLHPHVLPKEGDPEGDDPTIPLEEWDRSDDYQDLVERLESYRDRDRPYSVVDDDDGDGEPDVEAHNGQAVATDGGPDVDDAGDSSRSGDDLDDQDDAPANRFDCPACEEEVSGYPDECPNCGAEYNWE